MAHQNHITTYPEIVIDDDIAAMANRLIAEIAAEMLADGARAAEIVYMRHDLTRTFAAYVPNMFRRSA
jgi:fatty acid-binding protein DegV